MNFGVDLFLAWRNLRPKRNAVFFITSISVIGVALGVAVLMICMAVFTGFIEEMERKIFETAAHIQVASPHIPISSSYWRKKYKQEAFPFSPEKYDKIIKEAGGKPFPLIQKECLIHTGNQFFPSQVIGFDPSMKNGIQLEKNIREGEFSLKPGEMIISKAVASKYGLKIGDQVYLHTPEMLAQITREKKADKSSEYRPCKFTISALYAFGKYDFDSSHFFINIKSTEKIFNFRHGEVNKIFVWINDPYQAESVASKIETEFRKINYYSPKQRMVESWIWLNKDEFENLKTQKGVVSYLLIFIVLVAAFCIANTMIIVVTHKTKEIGIIKALGAPDISVLKIFTIQGFFVGLMGTALGYVLGGMVIFWRNDLMDLASDITGITFFPPEFYFFSELPASVDITETLILGVTSVVLCTMGALLPAWYASTLQPAVALRKD